MIETKPMTMIQRMALSLLVRGGSAVSLEKDMSCKK